MKQVFPGGLSLSFLVSEQLKKMFTSTKLYMQVVSVAHPVFPVVEGGGDGAPIPDSGEKTYYLARFLPQNA